jgi:hypothetical protein
MSNNPFLKSNKGPNKSPNKGSNNRFQFLDKELDVSQIKKEKKVVSKYDSADNSFTRQNDLRQNDLRQNDLRQNDLRRDESRNPDTRKNESRNPDLRRDDLRRDDRRNNNNNFKEDGPKKAPIKKAEFDLANEYFPDLVSTKEDSSNIIQPNSNFKDILNTRNQPEIMPFQEHIEPGWVKISRSNNEIIRNYGLPTEYEIQLKKQAELENDLHYCMTRGIEKMKRRWEKYKENYDDFNGEGAYDEKYTLPSIYDSDYDIEDESDDDTDSYSNNE